VAYGTQNLSFTYTAGVQQSAVIPNLAPDTNYVFTITATDQAGNAFENNPVMLNAETLSSVSCSGTDTDAQQGVFAIGYNYTFETLGTDVKITFELLDTNPTAVIAYLWKQNPFTETPMANVSGNIFTKTITGQAIGSTISYAVKFAYAGGLAVTDYFTYTVGNNCMLGLQSLPQFQQFTFENPATNMLQIHSGNEIDKIEIYSLLGTLVSSAENSARIDVKNLAKGIYLLAIYSGNQKTMKKLIIEFPD